MTVEMQRIQTCGEILDALLEIQEANAPKPKGVVINMERHRKAQARSGLLNHKHNKNPQPPGTWRNKSKPKTRY